MSDVSTWDQKMGRARNGQVGSGAVRSIQGPQEATVTKVGTAAISMEGGPAQTMHVVWFQLPNTIGEESGYGPAPYTPVAGYTPSVGDPCVALFVGNATGRPYIVSFPLAAQAGVPTPATSVTGPDAFGAIPVVGTSLLYARQDHDHGAPALSAATSVTGPDAFGAAAVVGSSLSYARQDHDHGLPAMSNKLGLWARGAAADGGSPPAAPGPFEVQAGETNIAYSGTPIAVTFPTAFSTGCLVVIPGVHNTGATAVSVSGISKTGFSVSFSGTSTLLVDWIAIGW